MDRRNWLIIAVLVVLVIAVGILIYSRSSRDAIQVTGGTVIIQTDQGEYTLEPGTTITIDPAGTWIITETVQIPTTRGTIIIEEGTELIIDPEPEPNYPDPNGG